MPFINTVKERFYGDRYFKEHVMAPEFDWRAHKKELSEYHAARGFGVSMMYDDYYSRLNGIPSDRYVSMDLYYFHIVPCLNRRAMQLAYADKNAYGELFRDEAQPETVVRNRNGFYQNPAERPVTEEEAVDACLAAGECIIKPSVETGEGMGVELLDTESAAAVASEFRRRGRDFIVQKRLIQHEVLARLNPTSLNSMRIMTYRGLDGEVRVLSGKTFLRVGGEGAVKDNVGAGGRMMRVWGDGRVEDRVLRYKSLEYCSLIQSFGTGEELRIPNYDAAEVMAKRLHGKVWYCDLLGWDIAIGADGNPVFIEMNVVPACESVQQGCGPIFEGGILDEIMERAACVKKSNAEFSVNRFRPGFDHLLQIGGEEIVVH